MNYLASNSIEQIQKWFNYRGVPLQDAEDLAVEVALKLHSAQQTEGEDMGLLASTRRSVLIDWIRSENKGYRQVQRKVRKIVTESKEVKTLTIEKLLFAYLNVASRRITTLLESFVTLELQAQLSEKGYLTPQIIRREQALKELIILVLRVTRSAIECKEFARWISTVCEVPLSLKVISVDGGEDQPDYHSVVADESLSPDEQVVVKETLHTFRDFILSKQVSSLQFAAVIGLMSPEFLLSELQITEADSFAKLKGASVEPIRFWSQLPFKNDEEIALTLGIKTGTPKERSNKISGARMQILRRAWPDHLKKLGSL